MHIVFKRQNSENKNLFRYVKLQERNNDREKIKTLINFVKQNLL